MSDSVIKVTRKSKEDMRRITMNTNEFDIVSVPIEHIHFEIKNPYPINDIEELKNSIKAFGLEQNLVVKKSGVDFSLISGHKRITAIKQILKEDIDEEYQHLQYVPVKIIDDIEDEIVTNLRKHETNLQARSLLQLEQSEKLEIIDDYLYWLDKARTEGTLINGKPIKGKTKDIVAERFGISPRTANDLIVDVKSVGGANLHTSKPKDTKVQKTMKIIVKLEKELCNLSNEDLQEILESDEVGGEIVNILHLLKK